MIARLTLCLLLAAATPAFAGEQPGLECYLGPVDRVLGGGHWNVYACDDGKHLVIVTVAGNPAAPFVFELQFTDDGIVVSGEGTGDKTASDAAYADIEKFSGNEVYALLAQAKAKGRH
jgi:hypothetical protein